MPRRAVGKRAQQDPLVNISLVSRALLNDEFTISLSENSFTPSFS
jgi:hypothetical protein